MMTDTGKSLERLRADAALLRLQDADTGAGTPLTAGPICECGLAKSYHGPPTFLADHEYVARSRPATDPAGPDVETWNAAIAAAMNVVGETPTFGDERMLTYRSEVLNRLLMQRRLSVADGPGPEERP